MTDHVKEILYFLLKGGHYQGYKASTDKTKGKGFPCFVECWSLFLILLFVLVFRILSGSLRLDLTSALVVLELIL